MKCSIITAALSGAAFASIVGAMNVIIKEGEVIKPAVPKEGVTAVRTEIFECTLCKGAGCGFCRPGVEGKGTKNH
jgi:hypothetical protein